MCTHKEFNKDCVTCLDIRWYCNFATKEGFADFDENTKWSEKVEYYNKSESYEPDEDYEDREVERQIEDAKLN